MGKVLIGVLAFVAGAAAGAAAVSAYFKKHGAALVVQGAADKIFGEGSAVGKAVGGAVDTLQGIG